MLVETTACQSWRLFCDTNVDVLWQRKLHQGQMRRSTVAPSGEWLYCIKPYLVRLTWKSDRRSTSGFRSTSKLNHLQSVTLYACLGGAVGSVAIHAAWLRWSASLGLRPGLAWSLCQDIAAYALRLNSRAGTEGSTVSSLICDHWLMLGLETLSISRCLNHW